MPNNVGLDKLAAKIRENNFHALLVIGGYEVNNKKNILFYQIFLFRLIYQFFKCMKLEINIQHFKYH
jgi:hypothetical protein